MATIELDRVTKRFDDGAVAVSGIDLEVTDGEFVILVGPSGCGKSTTLNMVAGLEDISAGELRIDGVRMNERAPRDRDVAMVFQSYALYPHMSVRENMAFPLRLAKRDDATVRRAVSEAAELLDLSEHLDRKPAALSGGQRQRVAMGRAIVRDPKAFLMDEPLSNLDAKLRVQMRTSVSRLQRKLGTTTLYVTHDQTEALTLGDRVVVMRDGHVQQIGSPQQLYDHPANLFVAGFIGSPAMNLMPAELADGALHGPFGSVTLTGRLRAATERRDPARGAAGVVVGLRPEHLADHAPSDPEVLRRAVTLTAPVDVVETVGSDKYAHVELPEQPGPAAPVAAETGTARIDRQGTQLVARLPGSSGVRAGEVAELWFDADAVQLFDPTTGANLSAPSRAAPGVA
ncbi:sn-glycerol-3-phosphate ABC transporter ATP-binding protein UgpC [Haloechinothrix sp. LS1_15]|uniref:ABC transporter ATP-binding protein n=1 Tax=Haloechinothrix sp. LS1_15 TaxID=2652248 RepID=UPI0029470C32|nr:sn-glycerol-3-phosphate ABC transporter ATP-binding protein UgpC [Haloechinothrix sp. LS1_15]MDV6013882.1 sn-glycerol-3-phosphate ABC transporter ATP-binding protein UgpC [Haloechinothrix sp. LS1_15]